MSQTDKDGDVATGTVHAIHGYLGVGKTWFARCVEEATGGVRLSLDEWLIGLSGHRTHLDDDLLERTWGLLSELWPRIVRAGPDVISDFGFWSRQSRDDARARAARTGAPFRLYSVTCSEATALARCRSRTGVDVYDLNDDAYRELRKKFEPLGADEPAELVDTDA